MVRTKTIKTSFELPRDLHRRFTVECAKLSKVERVTKSDVVRLLIKNFLDNGKEFRNNLERIMKEKDVKG